MSDNIIIRPATEQDVPLIQRFIRDLARYEHLEHEMVATEEGLRKSLFGERRYAEVVFACVRDDPARTEPVGFALFFHNYSTFLGKPGIYLEDLFVRPEARGRGIGKRLLAWLAQTAVARDCGRLEWAVLDWNEPSIGFYRSLGAVLKSEWQIFRLTGDPLKALAAEVPGR
ncbi:MAG TPA: GNAT family N-acetyltransferase [Steroidobacteraceae bacterium]|jgi:GNAT superfamily N-acetyltransferase|nr:GNAT family N-acetyltransferase [Steroidobacteraceae bacterium]